MIREEYYAVRQSPIEANNFEFTGHPSEDPNEHLGRFLRMANTVKLNGVNPNVIKLQLFTFSLRDIAASWFESLPYGSMRNWEELVEAYLSRFFPPALNSKRRGEIIAVKQTEDESLYNAWERYKQLLRRCLMHGIEHMDIFYHAMHYSSKGTIDAASGGAFRRKSAEEATQLIEELAKSNYRAPSEASGSRSRYKTGGVIELNKMTTIETKLEAIMTRMSNQERRNHSVNEVGIVEGAKQKNVTDQGLAQEGPYHVEEVQYLNGNRSYNFKPNSNLPTHYTPALKNHENLSYGGGNHQGQRPSKNYQ